MQKIMMPAKLWCDHAEGFESSELDVGEWERGSGTALADAVKYTVMMNMAPIFLRNRLQLGTYPNSAALRKALLQWCCTSRNFGANPTVSAGNGTSADDDWMQVDSLKKGKGKGKGKHHNQKGNRTTSTTNTSSTDINTCKNCGRTGHWAKDCWRPGGGAYDNSTSNNSNTQKAEIHKKGKGKSKHVDVVETNQPSETASTVSYPSQTPNTIGELSCNSNVEPWIMGVTITSGWCRVFASWQWSCPITYPGQKIPLPDPGIHTASGARLQHDGGQLATYKLPERRTIRVLFHACAVQKPILSLGCLVQQGYWIFVPTLVHCSFLTSTAKHSYTRKRVCSLSKRCWLCPCRQLV